MDGTHLRITLSKIHPNPYRRLDRYPVLESKVEARRASIRETSFWDNLVARPHPTLPGHVQLAYGHNRLEAVRREFSEEHEIGLVVRDLDNGTMVKIKQD